MCDKLGTYISLDSNEKTYFKNVCKELEENKNQLNDIEIKMLHLYQSADYKVLSKIRNFIVQCIVTQYFIKNGIGISERAYRELDEKGMIHRI